MSGKASYKDRRVYSVEKHTVMHTESGGYLIGDILGQGIFGKVATCTKLRTGEVVAVKIARRDRQKTGRREYKMLKKLRQLDPEKNNLVRFKEYFKHKGQICLAFERLDKSLFDFMYNRDFMPLHVSEIRVIAQQMLVALKALKSIKVVHGDIKPDNIMLVDHQSQQFKVKLIDFGLAKDTLKLVRGTTIQALGYRAPEVMLGLPLDESVDMWSLGCVLAFLFIGQNLYPIQTAYGVMRSIVKLQGVPESDLLNEALEVDDYFILSENSSSSTWRLRTSLEYTDATGIRVMSRRCVCDTINTLDDLPNLHLEHNDPTGDKDTQAFISLLKRILHVNSRKRITPSKAIGHPFITMKNLHGITKGHHARLTSTVKVTIEGESNQNLKCEDGSGTKRACVNNKNGTKNLNSKTIQTNKDPKKHRVLKKAKADGHKRKFTATEDMDKSTFFDAKDHPVEVKSNRKYLKRIKKFFPTFSMCLACQGEE